VTSVLIAYSDTGGGHRAAATALRDALHAVGRDITVTLVDPCADDGRIPLRTAATLYPAILNHAPLVWRTGFRLTDTARRARLLMRSLSPLLSDRMGKLAATHSPDVIIVTHPLLTASLRLAFPDTPIVVVVTDLVTGHASWYNAEADHVFVPTAFAKDRAVLCGVKPSRLSVIGVPIADSFVAVPGERTALQERLGWAVGKPTVLIAGGGEGIGPLETLSVAIDRAHLPCDIAIVAGRNYSLAARLRARRWQGTVHIYDFVSNFAELVRGASALVTKAGPGTISEACASGCPMVLFGAIPGQEEGNVPFVTARGAGVWAPSPIAVTTALHAWLVGRDAPAALRRASNGALTLARPRAAREIAVRALMLAESWRVSSGSGGRREYASQRPQIRISAA
jgi:1,2-diacylglycerol 3-beta-galactosyltransferase